jgi:prolipoprotein diacylglyceryltransferase
VFGLMLAGIFIAIAYNIPLLVMFDTTILSCTFGLFVGRLGCYNYGCCFGKSAINSPSVSYHHPCSKVLRTNPELKDVPLLPTQIYTAYFDLLMFILFVSIVSIYSVDGLITLAFIFLFNGFRIVIQKFRYTEQSDKINFSRTAIIYLILSLFVWVVIFGFNGWNITPQLLNCSWTFVEWAYFNFNAPGIIASILLSGIVAFLFYGVHGRQLGTHMNILE